MRIRGPIPYKLSSVRVDFNEKKGRVGDSIGLIQKGDDQDIDISRSPTHISSMVRAALIMVDDEWGAAVSVFGIPAVRRLVLLARRLGVGAVHVVGRRPFDLPPLHDLVPSCRFHVAADSSQARALLDCLGLSPGDRALVMRAGHVIDGDSLERLMRAGTDVPLYYAEDHAGGTDWAQRVWLSDVEALGSLFGSLWSGEQNGALPPARRIVSSPGLPAVIRRGVLERVAAESRLMSSMGLATRDHDSFLSRSINRRLSRPLSKALTKTRVTANTVTLFNVAMGLAGALLLSQAHYRAQMIGALLFLASVILDGVDGEVARLKLQESTFGHYLDIIGDNAVHVAVFSGIAAGLFRLSGDPLYLEALAFLLAGFGLCALAVNRTLGHGPGRKGATGTPWLTTLLANRDFAYLVVVCALLGRLDLFLFGTAAGVYVFSGILFVLASRIRGDAGASAAGQG